MFVGRTKRKERCLGVSHEEQQKYKEERKQWRAADFDCLNQHGHSPIEAKKLEKLEKGTEHCDDSLPHTYK